MNSHIKILKCKSSYNVNVEKRKMTFTKLDYLFSTPARCFRFTLMLVEIFNTKPILKDFNTKNNNKNTKNCVGDTFFEKRGVKGDISPKKKPW